MDKNNLRIKLLETGCFNDDEYLSEYINIITEKHLAKHVKYRTAVHHIVPRHYYKHNKLEIDNSAENLVELYHEDHARAHLYLSLCSKDIKFKRANASAMWFCLRLPEIQHVEVNKEELQTLLDLIDQLERAGLILYAHTEETKLKHRTLRWYTNGVDEILLHVDDPVPEGYISGRTVREKMYGKNKGTCWMNNGTDQVHIKKEESLKYLELGYVFGMLDRGDLWRQHTKEARENRVITDEWRRMMSEKAKARHTHSRSEWKPGHITHNKGKILITNGLKNKYINADESIPEGWRRGSTLNKKPRTKG